MRALVVYESMYGNTHGVAEAVAEGLDSAYEVSVIAVASATPAMVDEADLLVVGAPTHVHSMSSPTSRKSAIEAARKPASGLALDPAAEGIGVREWFDTLPASARLRAAAFDTRLRGPAILTGRAALGIDRRLRGHGFVRASVPMSFLVDKQNHLLDGELVRAKAWGEALAGPGTE